MNKEYFRAPVLVLQLVTNRKLLSVPGWTNLYISKDHNRNIGVQMDPSILIVVLPGID